MKDQYKTKAQLIKELIELRKRIVEPEKQDRQSEERVGLLGDNIGDGETSLSNLEWALSLSEVIEALKRISSGDPTVRIDEASDDELIAALKHMVNLTAGDIRETVELSHEF